MNYQDSTLDKVILVACAIALLPLICLFLAL